MNWLSSVAFEAKSMCAVGKVCTLNLSDFGGHIPVLGMKESQIHKRSLVNRPAMPFGNRKNYFRGSFQFSIVTIYKKISPFWKPDI